MGDHAKLYVNGALAALSASPVLKWFPPSNVFDVGRSVQMRNVSYGNGGGGGWGGFGGRNGTAAVKSTGFVGSVDELRVWSEALSASAVGLHFHQGPGKKFAL